MKPRAAVALLITTTLALASHARADAPPQPVKFDDAKLAAIPERMRAFVEKREVAGAVTLVATRDKVVHMEAVGLADVENNVPVKPDTIFWIASMTKPVTGVAILMLQEEGKLSVDDPAGKYIPALANLKTKDGKPVEVKLRHLLTHTAGMAEVSEAQAKTARTLGDLVPFYAEKPVAFEPGSQWRYSQSGINALGRVVEVASGQAFQDFVGQRLFAPLGMKDTTFYLTEAQMPRLAKPYKLVDGKLEPAANFILLGKHPTDRDRYPAANGGLYSTAPDYARFCRMLLNDGALDGRRYLKPESVRALGTVQSGEVKTGFTEGNGWGWGACVVRQPQGVTTMLNPGTFGHGGAYGTQAWIDPTAGVAYVLMVQRSNFPNADASDVRKAFQEAAAGAIVR